jgi:hypothetical protein
METKLARGKADERRREPGSAMAADQDDARKARGRWHPGIKP